MVGTIGHLIHLDNINKVFGTTELILIEFISDKGHHKLEMLMIEI
jgi:hypothetical protein